MNDHGVNVQENEWLAPGVRLTQQVLPDGTDDDSLASAVPVFIGWCASQKEKGAVQHHFASWEQARSVAQGWPPCLQDCVRHYFDNGGGPCWVSVGTSPASHKPETVSAWWKQVLRDVSPLLLGEATLTLVAVPQLVGEIEAAAREVPTVVTTLIDAWRALLTATARRPELFFVLDTPTSPKTTTACIQALRTDTVLGQLGQRAALYGPHLVTDYRKTGASGAVEETAGFRVVPPCGAVLGSYVRTDAQAGVWKAPANVALAHVVRPLYRETCAREWFSASQVSVNLIRSFAARGTRIWGCRTLAGPDVASFRYVQVRRTVTWIEANLKQICRFAVFEPNHEITWFQLRGLCNAWLRRMWLEGGLAGADEASAYSVRVGLNESMTASDLAEGRLIVNVAVTVLQVAEFIEVKLVFNVGDAPAGGPEPLGSEGA